MNGLPVNALPVNALPVNALPVNALPVNALPVNALEVRGLNKSFGGLRVTAGVELLVGTGERRLIIGPNGAGKTTLFNLITGEMRPDAGSIALFGENITRLRGTAARASGTGAHLSDHHAVSQGNAAAQRDAGIARAVAAALEPGRAAAPPDRTDRTAPARALERVGLQHLATRPVAQTSYGERRRIEIAMALVQAPKVLLLDEPFAGLSVEERRDVRH